MDDEILKFIKKQSVAFIASIDENSYPNMKAMLKPRKIEGNVFYFSTNTSSLRVAQFKKNPKTSLYFYHKGLIKYQGILFVGTMEVLEDSESKNAIWRRGDTLFYKKGVNDPDYCVLRFTAKEGRYYCDLKTKNISIS